MLIRKKMVSALACAACSAVSISSVAIGAEFYPATGATAIPNQYIVVYKDNGFSTQSQAESTAMITNDLVDSLQVSVDAVFTDSLQGAVVTASDLQLQYLLDHPDVAYVEQDQRVQIEQPVSIFQANPTWGLDRIDQRKLPLDKQYLPAQTGNGVTAYVIDTGINITHVDFQGRAKSGYDFVDNDNNSDDCNGHGTHVAGTIGGGQWGAAKQVTLVGVRVLNCGGSGTYSGVIKGIDWVAAEGKKDGGPSVANMSLGGGKSTAVNDAVEKAVDSGVFFAVAAGNNNGDACQKSPASAAKAYTVGSTTNADKRSSFSNYGSCVDIFAPGSSITSAWIGSNTATRTISGTSMASPHVAGAAALYFQQNPTHTPAQIEKTMDNAATKNVVQDAKAGSTNQLVYTQGKSVGGGFTKVISGAKNSEQYFSLTVPAGTATLKVTLSGDNGDADLYVKKGITPLPFDHDCASESGGSNESCVITKPGAAVWHIMVYGYQAYKNITLKAEY